MTGSNEAQRQADEAFAAARKKPAAPKKKLGKRRKQAQRRWAQEQHEPIDDISVQFRQIVANGEQLMWDNPSFPP